MSRRLRKSLLPFLGFLLLAGPCVAEVTLRVWPDKVAYDPAEVCTIQVHLNNAGPMARIVQITARVEYELSVSQALPDQQVTLEPGQTHTVVLHWKPPREVLGCAVTAQAQEAGQMLAQDTEYFNVVRRSDVPRVGICGQLRISGKLSETERALNRYFIEEGLRKAYINIAEAHGLYADALVRLVPDEKERKTDFFPRRLPFWISGTKDQIAQMKANGIFTTVYAFPLTNSTEGLTLARERPDLMMRFERGQASFGQFDVREVENPALRTPQAYKMLPVGWIPNQTSREVLDIAIGQLKGAGEFWGIDGVRWDGHYSPAFYYIHRRKMFDYRGQPVPSLEESDRLTAASVTYVKEALRRAYPDYLFMHNHVWPPTIPLDRHSEEHAAVLSRGGSACNECIRFAATPGTPYNRWSEMSRLLTQEADKAEEYGGYVYAYPEVPWSVSVTYSQLQYPLLYATRNRPWFAAGLYNSFMGGTAARAEQDPAYPFALALRPITRFATRYSATLFGPEMKRDREPEKTVTVTSPAPVWWKDYVRVRRLREGERQVTVDLLNPPAREAGRSNADESDYPAPQQDLTVTLQPAAGETVSEAWFLSPDLPRMGRRLPVQSTAGRVSVHIPELKYWGLVVFSLQGER